MAQIRFSDLYRMIDQPTLAIVEKKVSDLFALRGFLEKVKSEGATLDLRARASSLLVTQDQLEIKSSILISQWRDQSAIGGGRVDISLIEEAVFILSRIKIHEDNVDSLREESAKFENVSGNLIKTVKEFGPKQGISQLVWYGMLGFGGWFLLKKLLK